MKKSIALLLTFILVIAALVPALAAEDAGGLAYPTIYIRGKVHDIYNNLGTEEEIMISDSSRVFSTEVPDIKAYAKEKAKELLPLFALALITGDYDNWASKCSVVLEPIYRDFVLDKNGKPREGSGVKPIREDMPELAAADGTYPIPEKFERLCDSYYEFTWDWRLSPLDVADSLREYIDEVLAFTGRKKVNLISRCEGCCVAMAYFYKYTNDKKIANNVFLGSSANGVGYASNIFAGKFSLDSDTLNRYIGHNFATGRDKSFGDDLFGDSVMDAYVRETLCLLMVNHSLDWLTGRLLKMVNRVAPMIYPGLMMSSYGTCPAYWAMVRDEDYEQAKAMAGLNDNAEWANFVALIDEYHYKVQQRSDKILTNLKKMGVGSAIICKYGSEMLPFVQDSDEPSDNTTLVKDASFGATTAKLDAPFSDDYVNAAVKAGKGEYISPDRLIDASTCLFPEATWFIKYQDHDDWEGLMTEICREFIRSNGKMTVDNKNGFVRFAIINEDKTAEPMTAENANCRSDYYTTDKRSAFSAWLTALLHLLRRLPTLLLNKVKG